jgi:hypothetical protein
MIGICGYINIESLYLKESVAITLYHGSEKKKSTALWRLFGSSQPLGQRISKDLFS